MLNTASTEENWSHLGLFLSRDVIERRFRAHHGVDLDPDKAVEIISHLEQGRQYFRSAESSGVLAAPLEQYYGVLAFARAIVLYRNVAAREANLRKGHGLKAVLPGNGSIESIMLRVVAGTFDELLDATGNVELAVVDEPHPGRPTMQSRVTRALTRPQLETSFPFVELISRIPALRGHFEQAFELPAHACALLPYPLGPVDKSREG